MSDTIPTPVTDALICQLFVDHIVRRAQNSLMGLGNPEPGKSYNLALYEPSVESIAMLLVGAHVEKYDLVSLMAAVLEESFEHARSLERRAILAESEVKRLNAEIDGLRADKERLDFLESKKEGGCLIELVHPKFGVGWNLGCEQDHHPTLRAALDSARTSTAETR